MKWTAVFVAAATLGLSTPALAGPGGYGMAGIQLAVTNDAKSIQFYTLLGMKAGRLPHPGHQQMTWQNPGDGPTVMLIHKDASTPMIPGTAYLILFVPDLVQTVKALQAAGFANIPDVKLPPASAAPKPAPKPGEPPQMGEHRVKDPDGNEILLIGPPPK